MQKIVGNKLGLFLKIFTISLLVLIIMYYVGFFIWSFDLLLKYEMPLSKLYVTVNPFTVGSYILGISVLLYYILFQNIIIKAILGIVYILAIICTFVAIMGMSSISDFVIYIPHILIIVSGIVNTVHKIKAKKNFVF